MHRLTASHMKNLCGSVVHVAFTKKKITHFEVTSNDCLIDRSTKKETKLRMKESFQAQTVYWEIIPVQKQFAVSRARACMSEIQTETTVKPR